MKLIQITDTHLVPPGETLYGLNPRERLEKVISVVNQHHGDAELAILSGDLANKGEVKAYQELLECLSALNLPYHLMTGNHDNQENFLKVFHDTPRDAHGFVQNALESPEGLVLLLDTQEHGEHWGSYCSQRLEWLADQLERSKNRPVYLFMHHPPFALNIPGLDQIALLDSEPLAGLLGEYANIRHLFFGHVHRPIAGSWRGIPVSALRGTNHGGSFDFYGRREKPVTHKPPAFAVIFIEAEQTLVHLRVVEEQEDFHA